MSRLSSVIHTIRQLTAAPKDRDYLEKLNLKQLQKTKKPATGQDKQDFFTALQQEATRGPLFNKSILDMAGGLPELPKPITKWLANMDEDQLRDDVDPDMLTNLIRWVGLDNSAGASIQKLSWQQAVDAYTDWLKINDQDYGDYNTNIVVMDLENGYKIVQVSPTQDDIYNLEDRDKHSNEATNILHDVITEGELMQNCLKSGNYDEPILEGRTQIYSLRDSSNKPHATMEVTDEQMLQCLGKQNKSPDPKYDKYLKAFFNYAHYYNGYALLELDMDELTAEQMILGDERMWFQLVSSDRKISPDVWEKLTTEHYNGVKEEYYAAMVTHKDITPQALSAIASDSDYYDHIQCAIAKHPNTNESVLRDLAGIVDDSQVAYHMMQNKNCTEEVETRLSKNKDDLVRATVATYTTNADILTELAQDSDIDVLDNVLSNVHTLQVTKDFINGEGDYA